MTEAEWWSFDGPTQLLDEIGDKATDRKVRLLASACCRRVWHLLNARGQVAVETAELFADGQATVVELEYARRQATIDDASELARLRGNEEETPASVAYMLLRDAADYTSSKPTFSHFELSSTDANFGAVRGELP